MSTDETPAMTESEWLASNDPLALLRRLPAAKVERKRLLLVCAAWQQLRQALPEARSQQALAALEQLAENIATADPGAVLWTAMQIEEPIWPRIWQEDGEFQPAWNAETAALAATVLVGTMALGLGDAYLATEAEALRAAEKVGRESDTVAAGWRRQLDRLADLVRDVFGPLPFRAVTVEPTWLGRNESSLAYLTRSIYEERAFERLPVLADALEEAGCASTDFLNHCRVPGEHVRGCWVVDLLLGKQ
jgi:hypothetical protein